ncbi:MAG: hypothetical protein IJM54_08895 [Thermoguttaceae bacterium]|nr:hypothetical protein [Thermoguttaceae bacterium]
MNPKLVQQATLGTPDAWALLLRAGAESLLNDVRFQPDQTQPGENDFCEEDATETFSVREIAAALNLLSYPQNCAACVATLGRSNKRVSVDNLVTFMSRAGSVVDENKSTRLTYARLCGTVGRWLARFPSFQQDLSVRLPPLFHAETLASEQVKEEAERLWRTSRSTNERAEALKALRRFVPDEARELLDAVFLEEKPDVRTAFLNALTVNLGENDAPFLEKTLKSKSAECKRAALLLLCKIPTSRISTAMQERAELVASGKVPDYDADCEIAQFPKDEKPLAFSVVQAIPLRYWTEKHNLSPKQLGERYPFEEKTESLYFGWAQAYLNDVYDVNRKRDLDAPQVVLGSYPYAFEWLDFLFDLWKKVDAASLNLRVRWDRTYRPNFIDDWELSLAACDPHTARSRLLIQRVGVRSMSQDQWKRRIEYEPKPYFGEFTREYLRRLTYKNLDPWDASLAFQLIYFEPKTRKEIVQTIRERESTPAWLRSRLSQALGAYDVVEEFVSCFGEYEDPPLKRPSDC